MKSESSVKPFGKIGRRLLRWFVLVALIPLLFMGYQGYYFARAAVQQEVFLHMQAVAKAKRLAIESWMAERTEDMRGLTADPAIRESCSTLSGRTRAAALDRLTHILSVFQEQSRSYACLCLYDVKGEPVVCTNARHNLLVPEFVRSVLYQDVMTASEPVAGPIYLSRDIGPSMHLAATVRDEAGKPQAIVVATLALAQTLNPIILDTTGLGHTGQAYLIGEDKVMLTPSRFMNHPSPLTHTMDSEGIRRALNGTSGAGVYTGFEGQPVLGAWEFLPQQEWALIAEMDGHEAFAPLAILRRNALIVAVLTLAAIVMVVAGVTRSISRPIRQLADASLEVSQGNFERTVVVRLRDELGELAERFNLMVHSLKDSRASLQDAYDSLLRAQRKLVQSERLAAVGELAASVVHELRNPLSAVRMNVRIIETKCGSDPALAEHFALARTQIERLDALLEDLLDYAKPITLNRQPVMVKDWVADALRTFESERAAKDLRVNADMPAARLVLPADHDRLVQVLLNVLANAAQASLIGGTIHLRAASVTEDEATMLRLMVQDHGAGMNAETLARVFEPFFTTRKAGTGLGLPNARKLVEAHGGTLTLESRVGEGTTATILIPM
jgi:signal transduction histidine kinase